MAGQPGRGAPVRRGKAPPTNLPVVRDPLVGREREVVDAADRLLRDDVGHLTPTGVGGSGKTRLALRVAAVQPGFELTADNAGTVAALISQGHTNRQLAEALGITERTAEIHARNIREKLRFSTRTQIAAWATEQGLQAAATVRRLTRRSKAPWPAA